MLLLILFLITVILEFIVYSLFIRKDFKNLIIYSMLITLFTYPLANLSLEFINQIFIIEFFVFLIEIFLIKNLLNVSYKKSILISFIANLITFLPILFFSVF